MIDVVVIIALFVLGAALGSFAGAQVWRLRARQLVADKQQGVKVPKRELAEVKAISGRNYGGSSDRSVCLHCGRQLAWHDLLPVVSWLVAKGKCRTCKKPIGKMEIIAEVALGAGFAMSYIVWPYGFEAQGIAFFVIWLLILVLLAIHWIYDAKWFLLLDRITLLIGALALLFLALNLTETAQPLWGEKLIQTAFLLAILPGFYGLLYVVSRGAWIGFGDVKLLIPMALMLPRWEYGVLLIFLANLIGCIVLLPAMLSKKVTRTTRVPFGPFLILAFIITFLLGTQILNIYFSTILF